MLANCIEDYNFYINFGITVRKHRKQKKLSQDKLADLINVSRITIANIESGKYATQLYIAMRLITVLNIKYKVLFECLDD